MFRRILLAAGLFAFAIGAPAHSPASTAPHAAVTIVTQSLPPLF
jgi:hypothetical protein